MFLFLWHIIIYCTTIQIWDAKLGGAKLSGSNSGPGIGDLSDIPSRNVKVVVL